MARDAALAIDFGTSNSLVGAVINGKSSGALPLDSHAPDPSLMRTLLYFPHEDLCYYGAEAITQYIATEMEGRLFRSFKSHLANTHYLGTFVGQRRLPLEDMVGVFLLELKRRAEQHLGFTVDQAVIGRPARYSMDPLKDEFAILRMKKAAEMAGFKKVTFVPEPLAAAFDYRQHIQSEKLILIGDFGGGTSDFTLIRLRPDNFHKEDVLAIEGCPLAGDALDALFMQERLNVHFGARLQYRVPMGSNILKMPPSIAERLNHPAHIVHLKERDTYEFLQQMQKWSLTDLDKQHLHKLFVLIEDQQIFSFYEFIEKTKRALSHQDSTLFDFDYPEIEITETFRRSEFEDWALPTREKIFAALDRALLTAGVKAEDVDLVTLTGGTAQVPFIRQELESRFKNKLQSQSQFHSVLLGLVESARLLQAGHDLF